MAAAADDIVEGLTADQRIRKIAASRWRRLVAAAREPYATMPADRVRAPRRPAVQIDDTTNLQELADAAVAAAALPAKAPLDKPTVSPVKLARLGAAFARQTNRAKQCFAPHSDCWTHATP